jgi:small ligand-binding sensory domain FIST
MQWASAIANDESLATALAVIDGSLSSRLLDAEPDVLFVFVSAEYAEQLSALPMLLEARWPGAMAFGCTGSGIVGGSREMEQERAVSVTAAVLPGVTLTGFHLGPKELATLIASPLALPGYVGTEEDDVSFLLLPDPFSCDAERLLQAFDIVWPGAPKIGGLVSGTREAGDGAMFLGEQVHREGVIGLALSGQIELEAVVAQGCRPVSTLMSVTRSQENLLIELDGKPAGERIQAAFEAATEEEQALMRQSLFLGVVMDDALESPDRGDFLVRNILGADPKRGILAIGGRLVEHQTVQLHVRDARTSSEDLAARLSTSAQAGAPEGALLFSCLGRGLGLYGVPDHDIKLIHEQFAGLATGGFFCNGEIGPVGGTSFLHGYTSSIGLFRDPTTGSSQGGG